MMPPQDPMAQLMAGQGPAMPGGVPGAAVCPMCGMPMGAPVGMPPGPPMAIPPEQDQSPLAAMLMGGAPPGAY